MSSLFFNLATCFLSDFKGKLGFRSLLVTDQPDIESIPLPQPVVCVVISARAVNLGNTVTETLQKQNATLPMQNA